MDRSSGWWLACALALIFVSTGTLAASPPVVTIAFPPPGSSFPQGEEIWLFGSARDSVDGRLDGGRLLWKLDTNTLLGPGESIGVTSLATGEHQFLLSATSSTGETGTASVTIRIRAFSESPADRLVIDSPAHTHTHTHTHTRVAPSTARKRSRVAGTA